MDDLLALAVVDDDALDDVEEVVWVEEVVAEGQDLWGDVEFVEDAAFVREGEDAVCEVAFEVVAAGPGACAGEANILFFCFARFRRRKAIMVLQRSLAAILSRHLLVLLNRKVRVVELAQLKSSVLDYLSLPAFS